MPKTNIFNKLDLEESEGEEKVSQQQPNLPFDLSDQSTFLRISASQPRPKRVKHRRNTSTAHKRFAARNIIGVKPIGLNTPLSRIHSSALLLNLGAEVLSARSRNAQNSFSFSEFQFL